MIQENLLLALKAQNWDEIRNICFSLSEQEKVQVKKQTEHKNWEELLESKHLSYEIRYVLFSF